MHTTYQLVIRGPITTALVTFIMCLGLNNRSGGTPDSKFTVKIDPADISFVTNRTVSDFSHITVVFRVSLSYARVDLNWAEGPEWCIC